VDGAGVGAAAAAGQELAEDLGVQGAAVGCRAGGPGGDVAAQGAQGDGVGDAVGVEGGGGGGAGAGGVDELAGAQQGPGFLLDAGGVAGAQDAAGAAEEGLEFAVAGFGFPPLGVERGDLASRAWWWSRMVVISR